jgi:hypothetical protein
VRNRDCLKKSGETDGRFPVSHEKKNRLKKMLKSGANTSSQVRTITLDEIDTGDLFYESTYGFPNTIYTHVTRFTFVHVFMAFRLEGKLMALDARLGQPDFIQPLHVCLHNRVGRQLYVQPWNISKAPRPDPFQVYKIADKYRYVGYEQEPREILGLAFPVLLPVNYIPSPSMTCAEAILRVLYETKNTITRIPPNKFFRCGPDVLFTHTLVHFPHVCILIDSMTGQNLTNVGKTRPVFSRIWNSLKYNTELLAQVCS